MGYEQLPIEISISGIYFPPILIASLLGAISTWGITVVLHRLHLAKYIWQPPLLYLAILIISTVAIGTFMLPG